MRTRTGVLAACAAAALSVLAVPGAPAHATTTAPATGEYVYAANWDVASVSVISTATGTVAATVGVGTRPWSLAALPNGSRVYVANYGDDGSFGGTEAGSISVIDTATRAVVATLPVPAGRHPTGVVGTRDGRNVYLTTQGSGTGDVSVIDTRTHRVTRLATIGAVPQYPTLSADGSRLYVSNFGDRTVSVLNTRTGKVVATHAVAGAGAGGLAVSPDGGRLYVATYAATDPEPDWISVLDACTGRLIATVPVGKGPFGIALTPDGSRLYVPAQGGGDVTVIDTRTNRVTGTVVFPPGTVPMDATVSPDGRNLYVAQAVASSVSIVDTRSGAVTATIPTALGSWSLEYVTVR